MTSNQPRPNTAEAADAAVLSDLKRTLQPAGLMFKEGRQLQQGDYGEALAGLGRRQRRLGVGLSVFAGSVLILAIAELLFTLIGAERDEVVAGVFGPASAWVRIAMHVGIGLSQIWLARRCLRWGASLATLGERCESEDLDARAVLAELGRGLG